jgi:hypothetical protein
MSQIMPTTTHLYDRLELFVNERFLSPRRRLVQRSASCLKRSIRNGDGFKRMKTESGAKTN